MSEIQILKEFKNQLITFLDELISQFPQEGDIVAFRLFVNDRIPIKDLIDTFIFKLNTDDQQLRKMIKERNEKFFLDHNVFSVEKQDKVAYFKKLWLSKMLDNEDKKLIWNWIDAFIYIADKYTKLAK